MAARPRLPPAPRSGTRARPRTALGRPGEAGRPLFVAAALRTETVGGAVLLVAAVAAVIWANLPVREAYEALRETVPYDGSLVLGPLDFHLDLTLAAWAADGLLAVFFFIVGLELKRELVAGVAAPAVGGRAADPRRRRRHGRPGADLRRGRPRPRRRRRCAAGPSRPPPTSPSPWPCSPSSARGCRAALRAFLLTLAVVDDLLAIIIIAVFYTDDLRVRVPARRPGAGRAASALLVQRAASRRSGCCVPLAVAGLAAGPRVRRARHGRRGAARLHGAGAPRRGRRRHRAWPSSSSTRWRPVSAGFAVPLFAFFAAGVNFTERRAGRGLPRPGRPRRDARPGRRQGRRRLRHDVAARPVHPGRARRGPGLGDVLGVVAARGHRLHGVAADRRAGLRGRVRDRPARDGGRALRLADLGAAGLARARAPQPGLPPHRRAGGRGRCRA